MINTAMRPVVLILTVLAIVGFWAPMRSAKAELIGEIPYRIDYNGWYTVDVVVNDDGPYAFVVDSGATISSVFANLAVKSEMTPADREPVRIIGLSGAEMHDAVRLGDFVIGPITINNKIGVILDDWGPDRQTPAGVLGVDVLSRFLVEFDKRESVIRLHTKNTAIEEIDGRWAGIKLEPVSFEGAAGRIYKIPVEMNGVDIECVIDLGANGTIINRAAVDALIDVNADTDRTRRSQQLHDIFDNAETAPPVRVRRTKIARARWRNKVFLVHDALFFEELGVNETPFCLLGSDLMQSRSFIFDFEGEQFLIRR
ncbi:MAG: hypothetical protein HKN14_04455 [Marinicaulis sp.]|nr:hypothetical protein [Marinicaulis sp.]